jgi:hypothetical protein
MNRTHAMMGLAMSVLAGCGESAPAPTPTCSAAAAEGVAVAATDPYGGQPYALGYPPYAIDGCKLAYVAQGAGELRLRDLATGEDTVVAPASELPRRPAIAGELVAWEATLDGKAVVRAGGHTIAGAFDHAGEPRAAEDAVIFTGWLTADAKGDTDVFLYTPSSGAITAVGTGPGQQRFADVSATHAAWSDFSEDPDGTFDDDGNDVADLVVLDRAAMTAVTRKRSGKQAFPTLGATGKIAYLDWGLVHPEPKFAEYDLRIGDVVGDGSSDAQVDHISTLAPYLRPAARGDRLEWVATPEGGDTTLMRRSADLAGPAETVKVFQGLTVFGPSAAEGITLVGARDAAGGVTLRAFAR